MSKLLKSARKGSSASQIDIDHISKGILKLSGNRYRLILSTSSLNFELKSEDEQDALIDTYEGFLNSIGFPIQFLIRTREVDMDGYLESISNKIDQEPAEIYKKQLESYKHFIASLVIDNRILTRLFYIIIPYDSAKSLDETIIYDQLNLRADIIARNLSRLGIVCHNLSSLEVIDLFYSFYSPMEAKNQPLSEAAFSIISQEFITRR